MKLCFRTTLHRGMACSHRRDVRFPYIFQKGDRTMSEPKAPYYYNKNSDTYHWETSCSKNHYSASDPNWVKTSSVPTGKEQCNECKSK